MSKKVDYSIILPYFERPAQLKATLLSFAVLYAGLPLEVVIVDDGSKESLRPEIPTALGFPVKVVTLLGKNGINPCLPYNVGVRQAQGDILILSSPETTHIRNIFESEIWQEFSEDSYLIFQVFAVTDPKINCDYTSVTTIDEARRVMTQVRSREVLLTTPLGHKGYSYASESGSWYAHPAHRKTGLNFLSVIHKSSYERLMGFDERFRRGTGFDDLEFRDRLQKTHTFNYSKELVGIHLEHEVVAQKDEFRQPINSNRNLYWYSKIIRRSKTTSWGVSHLNVESY